jgi:hypothetical protein
VRGDLEPFSCRARLRNMASVCRDSSRVVLALSGLVLASGCAAAGSSSAAVKAGGAVGSAPASGVLSSAAAIMNGRVRCTARLAAPLRAGHRTGLTFVLRNISNRTVKVVESTERYGFVLQAKDVTYDTQVPLETVSVPAPIATPLRPGESRPIHPADVWVRWDGSVSIQPSCDGVKLPVLRTSVSAPSPAPTSTKAITDVVAAAGGLFDRCAPTQPGVAVTGTIDPPNGDAPPMRASCSIDLRREGRFWVAQTLTLVPPTLHGVRVRQPYEQLTEPHSRSGTSEAIAWQFVVTKNGATPVASVEEDTTTAANKMAPDWDWTGHRWQGPGASRCGGEGGTAGGSPDLYVSFVSACPL